MGGAPPPPLDFTPQGSKNAHFWAFFEAPPGATEDPVLAGFGAPKTPKKPLPGPPAEGGHPPMPAGSQTPRLPSRALDGLA